MNQRIIKIFPLILIVLMAHLFFPLVFIAQMLNVGRHDVLSWMLSLYVALGYTAFIFVAGAWSWFGRGTRLAWPPFPMSTRRRIWRQ